MSNVPKLRFKEFSGEWEEKPIKKVFSIFQGFAFSSNNSVEQGIRWVKIADVGIQQMVSDNPSYLPVEYADKYEKFLLNEGDYVLALTRPILNKKLKIALIDAPFNGSLLNQRVGKIVTVENINFIYHILQTSTLINEIEKNIAGSEPPNLSASQIENIEIFVPTILEQKRIASFLSAADSKIDLLTRKKELLEQYKKGVMQRIFSQELRFKAEDGSEFPEWEEKKLGDIFERVTRKNRENNQNVLTISAQQGLINQEEYFNKSVAAKDVTNYYLLNIGEFAYNKSYSNGYPMGAIKRLKKYEKGVVSTLYICFRINSEDNPLFYEHYFDGGFLNNEIQKIAQEGARNHGLLNVSVGEFFENIYFFQPSSIEEQTKIANFLSAIDSKIDLVTEQLDKAKNFKKGLLQQMFV